MSANSSGGELDPSKAKSSRRRNQRNASNIDAQMRARITMISLVGFFSILGVIVLSILVKITDFQTGVNILKIVAPAGSTVVMAIVGYYFGTRK